MSPKINYLCAIVAVAAVAAPAAFAQDAYKVRPEQSIFAVVLYKSGMGHNHLVAATDYETEVTVDSDDVTKTEFAFRMRAENLNPDDPAIREEWLQTIRAADIDVEFGDLTKPQRDDVRESMFSEEQLNPEKFPLIKAKVLGIAESQETIAGKKHTHNVSFEFTVHGTTVTKSIPAIIVHKDETLEVEVAVDYRFTEFGIEPYSALFGLARVKDNFTLFVHMTATPVQDSNADDGESQE